MAAKFTPGPWTSLPLASDARPHLIRTVDRFWDIATTCGGLGIDAGCANARLIAAAPEYDAIVRRLVAIGVAEPASLDDVKHLTSQLLSDAITVLAKVDGAA